MAGKEVRAGKAFVEIALRDHLDAGLKRAAARLRAFASLTTPVGAGLTGASAAILGPLTAPVHHFSEVGDAVAKMGARTAMSAAELTLSLSVQRACTGSGRANMIALPSPCPTWVSVLRAKNLRIGGPILLPPIEDLPHLARPLAAREKKAARRLAEKLGQETLEELAPIQMVGSGANLNEAADNGVSRLADLLGISKEEVLNRVTISGAVEIGRLPGVVTVTMPTPLRSWQN